MHIIIKCSFVFCYEIIELDDIITMAYNRLLVRIAICVQFYIIICMYVD